MPAVAEVQFKASGSQEVEGAFKSIGSAAQDSSTKIGQNTNAMKSMGQGMKSSVSSVGQVATAFAALTLSVVATWRSYRDLGDAQLAVDKANFKVQKSTQAVAGAQKLVAGLKAGMKKTDLESVAATSKIIAREEALKKKLKDGSITRKAAKAEQDAINLARSKVGSDKAAELAKAEQDLKNKTEALGLATESASLKQKHFNDSIQDFYLSLLPTAISTIAGVVSVFEGMKNTIGGGGGGLIGSISGIGLVLGAASVALLAYKNNWLGFRDAIGGVIDWIKARFGLWKDTIEKVFNLIKGGKWGEAFEMIKKAAIAFWDDLKRTVPLFGFVDSIIQKIKGGDWEGAFHDIQLAAFKMWEDLKKQVPFFAGAEVFVKQLFSGDFSGAFTTLAAGIKTGLESVFGKDAVGSFQEKIGTMINSAKNILSQFAFDLNAPGGAISQINAGFAKLGQGDIAGGFSGIASGIQTGLDAASNTINNWVLSNFGINLAGLEGSAKAIGDKILTGIKTGLTFVARTWIDPILVALLDPQTWITGFIAMGGFFVKIGTALYTAIGTALGNAAKDPKGTATWWADLGNGIWTGLSDWFTTNIPGATKALQGMAKSLLDAVETAKADFNNLGVAIWNAIIEGIRTFTGGGMSPFGGALDALKKNPVELPFKPVITPEGKKSIETWPKTIKPLELPTDLNTKPADKSAGVFKNKVERQSYIAKLKATTQQADQSLKQFVNKVNNTTATVKIRAVATAQARTMFSAGAHFQHGYQGTVKRPTMFMAGEGGRPEDVTVRPRGSVQRGGGGGGGSTHITISFEPAEFAQFIRYRINDNQGVVK